MGLSLELSEGADTSLLCFMDYVIIYFVKHTFPLNDESRLWNQTQYVVK